MAYILQIRFNLEIDGKTPDEAVAISFPFEQTTAQMNALPGFKWKTWLHSEDYSEYSSIYLFNTKEDAAGWAKQAKVVMPQIEGISNVRTQIWGIFEDYSLATHAPLNVPLAAEL